MYLFLYSPFKKSWIEGIYKSISHIFKRYVHSSKWLWFNWELNAFTSLFHYSLCLCKRLLFCILMAILWWFSNIYFFYWTRIFWQACVKNAIYFLYARTAVNVLETEKPINCLFATTSSCSNYWKCHLYCRLISKKHFMLTKNSSIQSKKKCLSKSINNLQNAFLWNFEV